MSDQPNTPPADPIVNTAPPADPPKDPPADPGTPPADPPKDPPKTVFENKDGDPSAPPPTWPDDWRKQLAGDDDKALKKLERYKSPQDIFKAMQEAQTKLSEGMQITSLPENATEEQVAEYRKKMDIPEDPKGYLESLPEGLVFGEEDEPLVATFVDKMHAINASPEVVKNALSWYNEMQEAQETQQVEQDREFRKTAEDELRQEWGGEYRANVNSIENFLASAPDGLGQNLMNARLADGTLLGANPQVLRWLANMADTVNPAGFTSPGDISTQAESVKAELDKIREIRRTNPDKYFGDEAMQERFRKLVEAEERLSA